MDIKEEHQCRVSDEIFHSYDELEKHCSVHISEPLLPEVKPNTSTEDTNLKTSVHLSDAQPSTSESSGENITLAKGSMGTVVISNLSQFVKGVSELTNLKLGNSFKSKTVQITTKEGVKINLEKKDNIIEVKQEVTEKQTQEPVQQPCSSSHNGMTIFKPSNMVVSKTPVQSEIVKKFPLIYNAINKPPANLQHQTKRKIVQSTEVEKERIKRPRLPEAGFACHLCGQTFIRKDKLRQHMHTHMKEKFYKCDICSEKFLEQPLLDKHRTKHFFKCDICEEGFVKYSDLKAHTSKHEAISKFTCPVCEKSFPFQSVLRAHMDVHNTGAFECDHCPAKFNGRSQLSKHFFTHHSNVNALLSGTKTDTSDSVNSNKSISATSTVESVKNETIKIKTEPETV